MKDIRIGNDIKIAWSLFSKGAAFSLEGLDLHVYLKDKYGRMEIEDFLVSGNVLTWTFYGKDQRRKGEYSLVLVINEGEKGMITTDVCQFVNLVSCSCGASGTDDKGVHTETIELQSNIEYGNGGDSYDELQEAIEDLDTRVATHSEEIVNLQENKADKSELTELSAEVGKKQDTISDLETIRSGASKGATALQSVPEGYATKEYVANLLGTIINGDY